MLDFKSLKEQFKSLLYQVTKEDIDVWLAFDEERENWFNYERGKPLKTKTEGFTEPLVKIERLAFSKSFFFSCH